MQPSDTLSHIGAAALGIQTQIDALEQASASLLSTAKLINPDLTQDELLLIGASFLNVDPETVVESPPPPEPTPPPPSPPPPPPTPAERKAAVRGKVRGRNDAGQAPPVKKAATFGLARSPKRREEMKDQQREREERLEQIMQWIKDHGGSSDPLTIAKGLGIYDDETARARLGKDIRDLADRGALEAGDQVWPEFKKNLSQRERGRTSTEYHLPREATDTAA